MVFNTYTNGDPRSFFYYKEDYYINGTEIILTDEYINSHQWNGRKLWKYARFHHQTIYNNSVAYFFCISKSDWLSLHSMGLSPNAADEYASFFVVQAIDIESAIQEVTRPIKLSREQTEAIKEYISNPQKSSDNTGLMALWVVYVIVMVASLIFKQFYIIWGIASYIFFKTRKEMLSR